MLLVRGGCQSACSGCCTASGSDSLRRGRRGQDPAPAATDPWIAQRLDELVKLYTHFHTHPELSRDEVETSKRVALELEKAGAIVTTNVGRLRGRGRPQER